VDTFGTWPAGRHLFHLVHYEELSALPTMAHWLGGPQPQVDIVFPDMAAEETAWSAAEQGFVLARLLLQLHYLREKQIELIHATPQDMWRDARVMTGYGEVSAEYTVTKTIQHTLDDGNTILRLALYWDGKWKWLEERPDSRVSAS
jgi:hypothetical protein